MILASGHNFHFDAIAGCQVSLQASLCSQLETVLHMKLVHASPGVSLFLWDMISKQAQSLNATLSSFTVIAHAACIVSQPP